MYYQCRYPASLTTPLGLEVTPHYSAARYPEQATAAAVIVIAIASTPPRDRRLLLMPARGTMLDGRRAFSPSFFSTRAMLRDVREDTRNRPRRTAQVRTLLRAHSPVDVQSDVQASRRLGRSNARPMASAGPTSVLVAVFAYALLPLFHL